MKPGMGNAQGYPQKGMNAPGASGRGLLDPMFAPRPVPRRTADYARRQSVYRATGDIAYAEVVLQAAKAAVDSAVPMTARNGKAASGAAPPMPGPRSRFRWLTRRNAVLYAMASVVFLVGLGVSLSGLHANRQVAAQVKEAQKNADDSDNVAPSTAKLSAQQIANYKVSPNIPRYLDIPKLDVHARVLSQGVNKHGQLQVPWNIYDTGWYNASSQPGQNGAMLVDGHSGIGKTHGVFHKIDTLEAGDPITITRGDGQKFTYLVTKVRMVDVNDVDMAAMLVSADTARPGLNLITCAGDQIPGTTRLDKRIEVFAVLQ